MRALLLPAHPVGYNAATGTDLDAGTELGADELVPSLPEPEWVTEPRASKAGMPRRPAPAQPASAPAAARGADGACAERTVAATGPMPRVHMLHGHAYNNLSEA